MMLTISADLKSDLEYLFFQKKNNISFYNIIFLRCEKKCNGLFPKGEKLRIFNTLFKENLQFFLYSRHNSL